MNSPPNWLIGQRLVEKLRVDFDLGQSLARARANQADVNINEAEVFAERQSVQALTRCVLRGRKSR